ncbi:MAG: hypothetical protein J6R47_01175 [Acholeplasmatales bacterium]|nr:hypothetical protein [Acholeplasmatales bacterium]
MQTPYEIGDKLWITYPWENEPLEATVSMMTVKADKKWKVRVSYGDRYGKSVREVKLEEINTLKGGLADNYEFASKMLKKLKEK